MLLLLLLLSSLLLLLLLLLLRCTLFFCSRHPLSSDTQAVEVYSPSSQASIAFMSALMASGFQQKPDNRTDHIFHTFLPCPVGTFSNSTSGGKQGCTECPPGK